LALLLLASAGGWLWHTAQAGLEQIEEELSSAVQLELASGTPVPARRERTWAIDLATMAWESHLEREQDILHGVLPSESPETQLNTTVDTTNLLGDLAVTDFVTTAHGGTQAYGQTRFYRNTAEGWQRTEPDAGLWGPPRRLESSYFIFHFRQNDAQAVAAAAPEVDALYENLQRTFDLAPSPEKLVIEVTVERIPGLALTPRWAREALVVPSPSVYLAPVELSDTAILVQSIALPLVDYVGERVIADHAIPLDWQSLQLGLQLWQLWELDMPLAHWRHDVVKWLYFDLPSSDLEGQSARLPEFYTEFCAMHSLWMLAPTLVGIPFECTKWEATIWLQGGWLPYIPRIPLSQLTMPRTGHTQYYDQESYLYRSREAVKVATILEYAVSTYGDDHLPLLLSSLAHYNDWDTLLPAVYGVSPSEFERGWQRYLAKEYAVQPN
jgi:hypothetical protein